MVPRRRSGLPGRPVGLCTLLPWRWLLVLLITFRFSGVYPYRRGRSLIEEMYGIGTAATAGMAVLIMVSLIFQPAAL